MTIEKPQHTIAILDRDNAPDEGLIPVKQTLTFDEWTVATSEAERLFREHGAFDVTLTPDFRAFDDLAAFIEATNFPAKWHEEHGTGGWMSQLTTSIGHWAGIGVRTPEDLVDYLDSCFQRDVEKEMSW